MMLGCLALNTGPNDVRMSWFKWRGPKSQKRAAYMVSMRVFVKFLFRVLPGFCTVHRDFLQGLILEL